MSKLARVEHEVVTLSPTNFQKLGDTYLARFCGWRIQSWGTMIGADKDRTGVPDAWCQLPDGRFVLLAYTTADKDLPAKLQKDLADCTSRTQPTIAAAQVERICLVFNRRCSPETAAALSRQAQVAGYHLELIGLDELARDILQDPAPAADLIGLDLGSGQLIHAPDFISIHQRQVGSTPFAQTLVGRETEQAELRAKLETTNLVLVTGPAGVGKTQLVLTVAQAYCAEQPAQRQLYFVFDKKSPDFIHELYLALRPGQQVVVVADDANRVSPYFDMLLAEQLARPAGTFKIMATVRDYARDSVARAASKNHHSELEVNPLSDEAIQKLVAAEPYCIRNGDYVRRIQELSQGRPRLAVMAALAARQAERLDRLHNVLDIYEGYFGPTLDELAARQNPLLGQVLALMYFFRVVHQTNDELAQRVEAAFGITPPQFWAAIQTLHDAELVEMHEGRIAKTADQILGNYVFYKIFLSSRPQLSYGQLLRHFFPQQQSRVVDTLNGTINDFTIKAIQPQVQPALTDWLAQLDRPEVDRWNCYLVFWPFLIPQTLAEAAQQLATRPWPAFEAAFYPVPKRNNHSYLREAPLFQVLQALCRHPLEEQPTALRLFLEFTAKHPDHFGKALGFLQSIAHFSGYDYHYQGLYVQESVVKLLRIGVNSTLRGQCA